MQKRGPQPRPLYPTPSLPPPYPSPDRPHRASPLQGINNLLGAEGYSLDGTVASSLPALRLMALAQRNDPEVRGPPWPQPQ